MAYGCLDLDPEECGVSDLWRKSAVDLAAMIRDGEVSSREVVQAHLDRIEEVNPALERDRPADARAGARGRRGRRQDRRRRVSARSAARRPFHGQGEHRPRGHADHPSRAGPGRSSRRGRCAAGGADARGRRDPDRPHQPARLRAPGAHRLGLARAHPQPMEPRAHRGRVERRRGGGARHRDEPDRPGKRPRRVAAQSSALLRCRLDQTVDRLGTRRDRDPARGTADLLPADGGRGRPGTPRR